MATTFLTPSKIALVFLVKFYCNGFVPPSKELHIFQLLISHIHLETNSLGNRGSQLKTDPNSPLLAGKDVQALQAAYRAHSPNDEDVNVWNIYEMQLCGINSLDTLLNEVKRLEKLLTNADGEDNKDSNQSSQEEQRGKQTSTQNMPRKGDYRITKLTTWSLFGIFVRRVLLEFEKLSFDDTMRVWRSFIRYCQPLRNSSNIIESSSLDCEEQGVMNQQSTGVMSHIIDNFLLDPRADSRHVSSIDAARILEFQINQMQTSGAKLPRETQSRIEAIIGSAANDYNLSNYLNFLQAWYKGDHNSSFEYLHRYYDYAMQHNDRLHYQYALLNMAILQSDFGSFDEAAAAIKEAMGTARENKDIHCLNYCLSWLYHFCVQHSDQSSQMMQKVLQGADGDQGIRYLKTTAKDYEMYSIEAQAVLLEAGESLAKGQRPLDALEKLYEASYLLLNHQLQNVKASQILLHSSVYARLGIISLARSLNNLVSECYASWASQEEIIHAKCRNAYFDCLAGRYKSALEVLENLRRQDVTMKLDQLLAQYIGVVKLKRKLHHHDLAESERLIAALKSGCSSHADLAFAIALSEVELQTQYGNFSDALSSIEAMFEKNQAKKRVDSHQQMKLLNAKVFLFIKTGRPQKGFSIAMRSATAAYKAKNAIALWESVAALVGVLVGMKEYDAAAAIAGSSMYRASELEDVAVSALFRKVGIDALVGQASINTEENSRFQQLRLALEWINEAGNMYKQLEDYKEQCEMNIKARVVLNHLGEAEAAKALESEYHETKSLIGT